MKEPDIKQSAEYAEKVAKLDTAVQEMQEFVTRFARENSEPGDGPVDGPVAVTGWILGIGVTFFHSDGEADDMILVNNKGLNNYMAAGMARAMAGEYEDQARFGEGDDED